VGHRDEAAARGEAARPPHRGGGGPGAGEQHRREASRRREGREESGADTREQLLALRLAVAEIVPRERRPDAGRYVHRPGVEEDHGSTPRARRSREVIASGALASRGPGGPGGPSAIPTIS